MRRNAAYDESAATGFAPGTANRNEPINCGGENAKLPAMVDSRGSGGHTNMRLRRELIASVFAIGFAIQAIAQQSSTAHRYLLLFKYSDQAMKAMKDNPQDRSAPAARLYESMGGKMEAIYFFPLGGEYDGMIIAQMPNDAALTALNFIAAPTGNFSKTQTVPLITADEYKSAMEKAKGTNTTYTPPTATRQ